MSETIDLRLVVRKSCHLCPPAVESAKRIAATFQAEHPEAGLALQIQDIADQVDLQRFSEEVPVLMANGEVIEMWRINEDRALEHLRGMV